MTQVSRRQFVQGAGLAGLGLLAGCGRLPGQAPGPAPKVPALGYLAPRFGEPLGSSPPAPPRAPLRAFRARGLGEPWDSSHPAASEELAAFRQGLAELNYIEGR